MAASAEESSARRRDVAIGVAGSRGIAALDEFLAHLPTKSGLALVIAHDLNDAQVAAVITRQRPPHVRLAIARDGDALTPDVALVAPAGRRIEVDADRVVIRDRRDALLDLPIDACLDSLAESAGDRAMGVLLCEPMRDGARGGRSINEAGGIVLLADGVAGATGAIAGSLADARSLAVADAVLAAAAMPQTLLEYSRRSISAAPTDAGEDRERDTERSAERRRAAELDRVIAAIHTNSGVDFSEYKRTTLIRRIERRMAIVHAPSLTAYCDLLRDSPAEVGVLYRELLIGVTRFFRDPEVWAVLAEKVVPALLDRDESAGAVRCWVAGCSTGEEAYSVAMLFREAMDAVGRKVQVKIFATDLDRQSVDFASTGVYPQSIVADVARDRLERFFVRKGDDWQVAKSIREMVIFAPHNLAKDPPFYKIDLITCRNLLIYLQRALQRRLLSTFHFALNANGFMTLGSSETLGEMASFFPTIDGKWKIFQRKAGKRMPLLIGPIPPPRPAHPAATTRQPVGKPLAHAISDTAQAAIDAALVEALVPPAIVVNEAFDIVHVSGDIDRYLKLPTGRPTFNVLKLATRDLSIALGTGMRKAFKDQETVALDVVDAELDERVRLRVRPFAVSAEIGPCLLVSFERADGSPVAPATFDLEHQASQRIKDLELEIEHTSESLQAAIEELETSNEELQATNEEVLAANEELQSTNEELQSVNEELYTVNAEHQAKIDELTELNNDLGNFLQSTAIGTIFLDERLCIRKFTPAITAQINVIDKDIGRPIEHLTHNLLYADLVADVAAVLRTLVPRHKEVRGKDGSWYLMRLMPYRTGDNVIKGVVLTFVDISEVKVATESIRRLTLVLEQSAEQVMITRVDGVIEYVNQRFCDVTGYAKADVIGRKPDVLKSGRVPASDYAQLWTTILAGTTWTGTLINRRRDGSLFREESTILPMRDQDGKIANFLKRSLSVDPS